jgi:hypothetical protein
MESPKLNSVENEMIGKRIGKRSALISVFLVNVWRKDLKRHEVWRIMIGPLFPHIKSAIF